MTSSTPSARDSATTPTRYCDRCARRSPTLFCDDLTLQELCQDCSHRLRRLRAAVPATSKPLS